jgi:hypothetical protein
MILQLASKIHLILLHDFCIITVCASEDVRKQFAYGLRDISMSSAYVYVSFSISFGSKHFSHALRLFGVPYSILCDV